MEVLSPPERPSISVLASDGEEHIHHHARMVGRDAEWAELVEALARAGAGPACVALIEGPAGMGRSRLLTEFAGEARRRGNIVFERSGRLEPVDVTMMAELARCVQAGPAARAVVVAYDDPQWTDLDLGIADVVGAGVMWVLTRRTPAPRPAALDGRSGPRIQLPSLGPAAVRELLADLLGAPPPPQLLELARSAAGNPGALHDLVEGLLEEHLLVREHGRARLTGDRMPDRMRRRVRHQFDALGRRTRQLLQVASVAGPSASLGELAALIQARPANLLPAVEEALASGLLVGADCSLTFSHDGVRALVAASVPPAVRHAIADELARTRPAGAGAEQAPARHEASPAGRPPVRHATSPAGRPPARHGTSPAGGAPARHDASPAGGAPARANSRWESLTTTERAIVRLVDQGLTNRQIAARIFLSPHTVNYHLGKLYTKLGVHSRQRLARAVPPPAAENPGSPAGDDR